MRLENIARLGRCISALQIRLRHIQRIKRNLIMMRARTCGRARPVIFVVVKIVRALFERRCVRAPGVCLKMRYGFGNGISDLVPPACITRIGIKHGQGKTLRAVGCTAPCKGG